MKSLWGKNNVTLTLPSNNWKGLICNSKISSLSHNSTTNLSNKGGKTNTMIWKNNFKLRVRRNKHRWNTSVSWETLWGSWGLSIKQRLKLCSLKTQKLHHYKLSMRRLLKLRKVNLYYRSNAAKRQKTSWGLRSSTWKGKSPKQQRNQLWFQQKKCRLGCLGAVTSSNAVLMFSRRHTFRHFWNPRLSTSNHSMTVWISYKKNSCKVTMKPWCFQMLSQGICRKWCRVVALKASSKRMKRLETGFSRWE